jgi:hypothetical protein
MNFSCERSAPTGDFITIAKMHIDAGHPEEAKKLMSCAEKIERFADALQIKDLLEEAGV